MAKDIKIMLGVLIFSFLLIVGFAYLMGGKEEAVLGDISGVQVTPGFYELGDIPINEGIVTREYEIKNTTESTIKLKKIVTSCMCTEAKIKVGDKETRFFDMEHPTDKNPPVNIELAPNETAKVIVNFDPAAHGPAGIGPFDRSIILTFSDPPGIKELTFNGTVVSE